MDKRKDLFIAFMDSERVVKALIMFQKENVEELEELEFSIPRLDYFGKETKRTKVCVD